MKSDNNPQMNSTSLLASDETLDGFSQVDLDVNRENTFEVIHMENSNSSDVDNTTIVKRKREDNTHRVDKRNKHIKDEIKSEQLSLHLANLIEQVQCDESCSLFNSATLSWRLGGLFKNLSISFVKVSDVTLIQQMCNDKNGILLQLLVNNNSKKFKEIYLLIELFETNAENSKDQIVHFCNKKCGIKRKQIIELQDSNNITVKSKGNFEISVRINEQCSHKSENQYGSPQTRFYFKMQLFQQPSTSPSPCQLSMSSFFIAKSNHIKVVAPGKAKPAAVATSVPATSIDASKVKYSGKMTLQQTMETLVSALQGFDERLTKIETINAKKLEELEQRMMAIEAQVRDIPNQLFLSASTPIVQSQESQISVDLQEIDFLQFCEDPTMLNLFVNQP